MGRWCNKAGNDALLALNGASEATSLPSQLDHGTTDLAPQPTSTYHLRVMSWTGEGDVVVPEGTPHEIQTVKNYRFQVSSPIGCTRLCVGETQGNTARPVTGTSCQTTVVHSQTNNLATRWSFADSVEECAGFLAPMCSGIPVFPSTHVHVSVVFLISLYVQYFLQSLRLKHALMHCSIQSKACPSTQLLQQHSVFTNLTACEGCICTVT